MRVSKFLLPLIKEKPQESEVPSHALMLRAGMIKQVSTGIYTWLPLGLRVLDKISEVIRIHLNRINCIELRLPSLQPIDLWEISGRDKKYGPELLRIRDRNERSLIFAPTNEELITDHIKSFTKSYKDLPLSIYNIQNKFRDELRPRYGVLRGREFLMKDAYTFDIDKVSAAESYDLMYSTYFDIFSALGLKAIATTADNGPMGGEKSHEFLIFANTGETTVYYDKDLEVELSKSKLDHMKIQSIYAATDEIHDHSLAINKNIVAKKAIEVGHIFLINNDYSRLFDFKVPDGNGKYIYPEMGCYGIGISRLVAAAIESSHDEEGIIWPKQISPFSIVIVNLGPQDISCVNFAEDIYQFCLERNIEVLYEDRNLSVGQKLKSHDLIGIPLQLIIGPGKIKQGLVELKYRKTKLVEDIPSNYCKKIILKSLC